MTTAIVDRLARVLERRLDRRGFLARTALGGAALSVAPVDFTLRPLDAYAAICQCNGFRCDCGSACCDGYTEFCCTLYGLNRCPPGSVVAGWWKVDGSNFCGGSARYYMDCNASCGSCGCTSAGVCAGSCSGTTCGCAFGDCNNRRAGCVQFRYGQCNQQITCVGPIICRLVSCIPPWEIDASCTRTVAVDEGTRFHDAPCLHAGRGSIDVITLERRTMRLQGWALDPNTTEPLQIRVLIDGELAATAVADRARTDLVQFFPGAGPNHGFDVSVTATPGAHTIEIYGLQTHPAGDIVRLTATTIGVSKPFGSFDVMHRVPGGVRVAGWLIDPNSDGSVHIYVDNRLVQIAATSIPRPDVAAAFAGFGNVHGFDTLIPLEPGPHTICLYGYNEVQPNDSPLIGCRSITINAVPHGSLDIVTPVPGGVRIAGWALDPDTAAPVDIHIYVDGVLVMGARADQPRPDVNVAHNGYGPAHGFDLVISTAPGVHDICVYALNQSVGNSNSLIGCRTLNVTSVPIGALDVAQRQGSNVRIAGWAIDPDTVSTIDVHMYADGRLIASAPANLRRGDVGAVYPAYGPDHGFDVTFAAPGARTICVYGINAGAGTNSLIACRTVS
jgi:hypothetical protein